MKKSIILLAGLLAVALSGSVQAASCPGGNCTFAVQDSSSNDNFYVYGDGSFAGGQGFFVYNYATKTLGSGLSIGHAPEASFHVADLTNSSARGLIVGQHDASTAAANVIFRKSHGTDLAPTAVASGDYIAAFHGNVWNGSAYITTATINYLMDGTVSTTSAPQAIIFSTGTNNNGSGDPTGKIERLRITSTGDVVIANKGKNAVAAIMPSTATMGFMYVPTVDGALTTCATIGSQYPGHAPLWVNPTNNQLCTCNGATIKCATLN
jgi:hypothetical protein